MTVLYRVVGRDDWEQAKRLGYVPPCGSDRRAGWVHLNCPEDVALVLELDLAGLEAQLAWHSPTAERNWQQPVLKVPALKLAWVSAVHALTPIREGAVISYRLGIAEPV